MLQQSATTQETNLSSVQHWRCRSLPHPRTSNYFYLCCLCALLFTFFCCRPRASSAFDTVRAEIGKETAWTGEAVPLIITLYSPGPFDGTASFDLPELPQTAFLRSGSPLVGSEEVDGESYMTQRHEFTLYAQRVGEIVIPAFQVRFSGKKSFTTDPEPMEGSTPELRFHSKRPPGTESMGIVICATNMEIQQTWNPEPTGEIQPGDVIVRTIVRKAEATTAMMLPDVSIDAPDGIQVYAGTPEVRDKIERGDSSAERTDTVKYQFRQAGSFALPELVFLGWNPEQEQLQRETVPGLTVQVAETVVEAQKQDESQAEASSYWMLAIIGLLAISLTVWLLRKPLTRWIARWQAYYNRPEACAARKLRTACAANDASTAYAALTEWLTIQRIHGGWESVDSFLDSQRQQSLREPWQALSRTLYDCKSNAATWDGTQLWRAFSQSQSRRSHEERAVKKTQLAALNP